MAKLYGALVVLSLIWGTSFLFIKILLESLEPATVVFGRCLFGVLFLAVVTLVKRENFLPEKQLAGKIIIVAIVNNVLPWLFISLSETQISTSLASIINATTPIWTLMIGFFFFSSTLSKNQWAGIGIGFIGIFILSDIRPGELIAGNTMGIFLMSAAAFCYGTGTHLTKKYLTGLSVSQISFFTLAASSILSFLGALWMEPASVTSVFQAKTFLPLLGVGTFGSGVAYLLYYFLVKEGSPEFASLVTYLVPVSAILWGALLLQEKINLMMILGLIIILLGVFITSRKDKSKRERKYAA